MADTSAFEGSRSSTVDPFTVAASIGSLKVTVTFASGFTLVAPAGGVNEVTVGGVVSAEAQL